MNSKGMQTKSARSLRRKSAFQSPWHKSVGLTFDSEALQKTPRKKTTRNKSQSKSRNKIEVNKKLSKIKINPIKVTHPVDIDFEIPVNTMKTSVIKTKHDILKDWKVKKDGSFQRFEKSKERKASQEKKSKPQRMREKKMRKGLIVEQKEKEENNRIDETSRPVRRRKTKKVCFCCQ